MTTTAKLVEAYLGRFIQHMIDVAPNSATGDNYRRAAELMIEVAIVEERARCLAIVQKHWVRELAATEIDRRGAGTVSRDCAEELGSRTGRYYESR